VTQQFDLSKAAEQIAEVRGRQFPRYPAYKPSGISWLGDIPAHWQLLRLRFIATTQSGLTLGKRYDPGTTITRPYLRVANVQDGYLDLTEITRIELPPSDVRRFELQAGDVLMTEGGDFDKLGRGYVWEGQIAGCLHQNHIFAVRPHAKHLDSRFLARVLTSSHGKNYFTSTSQQTTNLATTNMTKLGNLCVPLPKVEEQKAIGAFLDRETAEIDALIAEKQRLMELLKEKRTALISHAVTKGLDSKATMKPSGIDWLGDVPAHWEFRKLGFMTKMRGGATPSKSNEAYWVGNIPWVSPKDMKVREISDSEDHLSQMAVDDTTLTLFDPPVVLMVVRGMILAHTFPVGITRVAVTVNQDMKALQPCDGCLHEYLLNLLDGASHAILGLVEESAHGTKVLRTNLWKHFGVFVPGEDEQGAICRHINELSSHFDALIAKTRHAVDKLNEYRSAVISAAVTGKIDVRGEK